VACPPLRWAYVGPPYTVGNGQLCRPGCRKNVFSKVITSVIKAYRGGETRRIVFCSVLQQAIRVSRRVLVQPVPSMSDDGDDAPLAVPLDQPIPLQAARPGALLRSSGTTLQEVTCFTGASNASSAAHACPSGRVSKTQCLCGVQVSMTAPSAASRICTGRSRSQLRLSLASLVQVSAPRAPACTLLSA